MLVIEPNGWNEGDTFLYSKGKWTQGCVTLSVRGEFPEGSQLSVEMKYPEEDFNGFEWKAMYRDGTSSQFPIQYNIVSRGQGYKEGDRITVGNHAATVSLTTFNPSGGIAEIKDIHRGEHSEAYAVVGGSGEDSIIQFPKSETLYANGMTIKIYSRKSSKLQLCHALIKISDGSGELLEEKSSPGFIIDSKLRKPPRKRKREAVRPPPQRAPKRRSVRTQRRRQQSPQTQPKETDEKDKEDNEEEEGNNEEEEENDSSSDEEEEEDDSSSEDEEDDYDSEEENKKDAQVQADEFDSIPFSVDCNEENPQRLSCERRVTERLENEAIMEFLRDDDLTKGLRDVQRSIQTLSRVIIEHTDCMRELIALTKLQKREY